MSDTSLASVPYDVFRTVDPRIDNYDGSAGILIGPKNITWQSFTAQGGASTSSLTYNIVVPAGAIMSRRIQIYSADATITGTVAGNVANDPLLSVFNQGFDALSAFPINRSIQTCSYTWGVGNTVTSQVSDTLDAYLRTTDYRKLTNGYNSLTPTYTDKFQSYVEATNGPLNCLDIGTYYEQARGAFPMDLAILNGYPAIGVADVSATLTFPEITEPLLCPGLVYGEGASFPGFRYLDTVGMQLTINFQPNLANLFWTHAQPGGMAGAFSVANVTLPSVKILCEFCTPPATLAPTMKNTYDWRPMTVSRHLLPDGTIAGTVQGAIPAVVSVTSDVITLNGVPHGLMIFVRTPLGSYGQQALGANLCVDQQYGAQDRYLSFADQDSGCLQITWNNNAGIFSGSSRQQLYQISVASGIDVPWNQWSGEGCLQFLSTPVGNAARLSKFGSGSIFYCRGVDLLMDETMCPGAEGMYSLQIQANMVNRSPVPMIQPTLYVVAIYDGAMSISQTHASRLYSPLFPKSLVAQSAKLDKHDYIHPVIQSGGRGSILSKIGSVVKRFAPLAKMLAPALALVPGGAPFIAPLEAGLTVAQKMAGGRQQRARQARLLLQ